MVFRRQYVAVLFAAIAVLAICRIEIRWLLDPITHPAYWAIPSYNYAILQPNYFNSGFMRRGLGGTIFAFFDSGRPDSSLAYFQIFMALWISIPLGALMYRISKLGDWTWLWFGIVLVASPQLVQAWSHEIGKSDMLICGFVAWAVLNVLDRRFVIASVLIFMGSLCHETAVVYGLPLCSLVWFSMYQGGKASVRDGVLSVGLLLALLFVTAIAEGILSAPRSTIASIIVNSGPADKLRYQAAYMTSGGLKSITTSLCESFSRPPALLYIFSIIITCAMYSIVLLARAWKSTVALAFAALLPMLFMSVVAVDYGRWLCFAVMNAWLAAVTLRLTGWTPSQTPRSSYLWATAVLAALVAMGPATVFSASKVTTHIARRIWGPVTEPLDYFDQCDPSWRDLEKYRADGSRI
jgi:hypothetical protein